MIFKILSETGSPQKLMCGQSELSLWLLVGAVVVPRIVRWVIILSMEWHVSSLWLGIGYVVDMLRARIGLWGCGAGFGVG